MPIFLLTIPCIIVLIASIIWIYSNEHYRRSSGIYRGFSILFFILSYNLFVIYGHQSPLLSPMTLPLTYTDATLFYFSTPLFYIFLLNILEERPFLSPSNAKHLWTMIPGLIYFVEFSTLPREMQEQVVVSKYCGILPDDLLYFAGAIGIFLYLYLSLKKLHEYIDKWSHELTSYSLRQLYLYSWVLYAFGGMCICFGILSLLNLSAIKIHYVLSSLLVLLSGCELFIVFYIKPSKLQFIGLPNNMIAHSKIPEKGKNEQLLLLAQQIDCIIKEEKLYLNHQMDLNTLSEKTGINSNKITACIHEQFSMSVPEYINIHRIEHAKNLLSEPSISCTKIDILAYESGYSSRSNFYSTFKRITGQTPIGYRESVMKKNGQD